MIFIRFALARMRDKHRKGLLLLWAFERFTGALSRIGLHVHLSVIYLEEPLAGGSPELRLSDCSVGFATARDVAQIAAVEGYPIPVEELEERLSRGAECYLLRHRGQIVAFTWCEAGGPPRPRLGLRFDPTDAYLFDAHAAPSFRGLNLLPYLRYRLYGELGQRGYHNFLSSTVCFNGPAHRFKQKLGARPRKMTLYLSLFGHLGHVFVVWRFKARTPRPSATEQPVA